MKHALPNSTQVRAQLRFAEWKILKPNSIDWWSFVQSKQQQRWLWHAIDYNSGAVLAYVLAPHHDEAFVKLKALLEPFEIAHFSSDGWGAYERHLDADIHMIGKRNTQLY